MRARLAPGAPATGFAIAACFALLAHLGVLANQAPIWDDAVFLLRDERMRSLTTVLTAFGDTFFGALRLNEMYRPVVNASFAFDWWISGSAPGDVRLLWFHVVSLLLHAANAGLVYLFLANLTGRKLGAPILAACLFAVHPLAVEPTAWLVGRGDLFAAFFGLLSGILLLRSPGNARLLAPAVVCYGLSLFAKASAATMPAVVALGVIAYRGVPLAQRLGRRHLRRFLWFIVPAAIWLFVRWRVFADSPFPNEEGRLWNNIGRKIPDQIPFDSLRPLLIAENQKEPKLATIVIIHPKAKYHALVDILDEIDVVERKFKEVSAEWSYRFTMTPWSPEDDRALAKAMERLGSGG